MSTVVKIVTLILVSSLLSNAHEVENHENEHNVYIAFKGLSILGSSVKEEEKKLKGDSNIGAGIDIGYVLAYGFSIETDITYARNTIKESSENEKSKEFSASYTTSSLDMAYKYHLSEKIGLVAKVGYEYEYETIENKNEHDTGFVYAGAMEFELSENIALLGEYERTTIKSTRGNSIFLGLLYAL